ncbi:lysophospholipid acyltransferase family protein [Vineibacter terrae]|nr:1-acyl-sn-glycerol-3-phosphate acyltransferase [Vineibacter terrae]
MPLQFVAVLLRIRPLYRWLPVIYHRVVCYILGIRIEVYGQPSHATPTLFVGNHVSYLDVEVLSSILPVSFIAKSEVASWPFFGWLARLQRTVFIERRQRATGKGRDGIQRRLDAGDDLVLFAEGTSGDGTRVLPFRSALLGATQMRHGREPVPVQPFTIAYARLDGIPVGRLCRPFFAWFGDMELAPHLWNMMAMGEVAAIVVFHDSVDIDRLGDRKKLSEHCFRTVSRSMQSINRGRYDELPPPAAA